MKNIKRKLGKIGLGFVIIIVSIVAISISNAGITEPVAVDESRTAEEVYIAATRTAEEVQAAHDLAVAQRDMEKQIGDDKAMSAYNAYLDGVTLETEEVKEEATEATDGLSAGLLIGLGVILGLVSAGIFGGLYVMVIKKGKLLERFAEVKSQMEEVQSS